MISTGNNPHPYSGSFDSGKLYSHNYYFAPRLSDYLFFILEVVSEDLKTDSVILKVLDKYGLREIIVRRHDIIIQLT